MFRKIFAFVFVLSIGASAVWAQTLDGCPSINPYELGTGNTEVYRDCANINDGVTFVANALEILQRNGIGDAPVEQFLSFSFHHARDNGHG